MSPTDTPTTPEPGAFWNEPGGSYVAEAMEALGVEDDDLEMLHPEHERADVPMGKYPVRDRVYAKAWELRNAEERDR